MSQMENKGKVVGGSAYELAVKQGFSGDINQWLASLKGSDGNDGSKGDTGDTGKAATIKVGTVTTLAAGSSATVTNVGTEEDAVINFGIPRGEDGKGTSYDDTEIKNEVATKQDKPTQIQSATINPIVNLVNNQEYTFTSPLSSLTISTQEGIGSIYFLTNNSFSVTLPESIIWDGGTAPEWKPFSIYVLVYFNGIVMASKGA